MIVDKFKRVTLENEDELKAVEVALRHYVQNHALRPDENEGRMKTMRRILIDVEDIDVTYLREKPLPAGEYHTEIVDTFVRDGKLYCDTRYITGEHRGLCARWRIA